MPPLTKQRDTDQWLLVNEISKYPVLSSDAMGAALVSESQRSNLKEHHPSTPIK
jgi:hypothetical protein